MADCEGATNANLHAVAGFAVRRCPRFDGCHVLASHCERLQKMAGIGNAQLVRTVMKLPIAANKSDG